MHIRKISDFQKRVYDAVSLVPRGRVTTYGLLAHHLGCGSAQAVGQALKHNPFAPQVPCHRVIASDMTVGGFRGLKSGPALDDKVSLLEREGVKLVDGKLKDRQKVYTFGCGSGPDVMPAGSNELLRGGSDG